MNKRKTVDFWSLTYDFQSSYYETFFLFYLGYIWKEMNDHCNACVCLCVCLNVDY